VQPVVTANPRVEAVAARTEIAVALLAIGVAAPVAAEPDERWPVLEHQFAFTLYDQLGLGFQSQAGEPSGPGSEDAVIFQPQARVALAQSEAIRHDITVGVDVITAASPDAVDVVSQASLWQEALSIEVDTTIDLGDDDQLAVRGVVAREENLLAIAAGLGYRRELADDNTTLAARVDAIYDAFDDYRRDGRTIDDLASRRTLSTSASVGQLLSPTTIAWASYSLTYQRGQLATPHNTAPIDFGGRYKERFPESRWRNALAAKIAQRLPAAEITLRAGYRYYRDNFAIRGHTADLELYRDLGESVLARISYRYHRQSAARFFGETFARNMALDEPRTADSDLDRFSANEVGARVFVSLGALHEKLAGVTVDAAYRRYVRTNGLAVDVFSTGYTKVW